MNIFAWIYVSYFHKILKLVMIYSPNWQQWFTQDWGTRGERWTRLLFIVFVLLNLEHIYALLITNKQTHPQVMGYSNSADRGGAHNMCWGGNESSLKDSKGQWTLGSLELIDSHSGLSSLEHIIVGNKRGYACSSLLSLSLVLPTTPKKEEC